MYWNSLTFASLLVNASNILIYSGGFLSDLQLRLFSTKAIDVRDTYPDDIYAKSTCIEGFYVNVTCIGNIYGIGTSIRYASIESIYVGTSCIKGENLISWDGYICNLAYKSSKFFISFSRLLEESTSEIFISFCLRLWAILDKVLYCRSIYWIVKVGQLVND